MGHAPCAVGKLSSKRLQDEPPGTSIAVGDAAMDAVGDAAMDAVGDADMDAVGDADMDAVGDAVMDAVGDAVMDATFSLCGGTESEPW